MGRMEEFRAFVTKYPKVRDDVVNGNRTWQDIYEDWVLFGEKDDYSKYANSQNNSTSNQSPSVNLDSIKSIVNYVQKLDPDSVNKTLNTVQKLIQIVQTVGPKTSNVIPPISGLYSDWWD